jgi:hypothetical protein
MACLGRHGRWGNTLLGYFFLRAFAWAHDMIPEVPRWLGQDLFGPRDAAITRPHRVVLYDMVSEICQPAHHPMVTFEQAVHRAGALREVGGRRLYRLREPLLAPPVPPLPWPTVDLEGPYLVPTRHLAPVRERLRHEVRPIPSLRGPLEAAWADLRRRGDVVIGLHLRRGDFDVAFSQQGFEFIAPMRAYLDWLEAAWSRFPRPVLFVATDAPAEVLPALARFRPVSAQDLPVRVDPALLAPDLPPAHAQREAAFFPAWFVLTRCGALGISNSTFSFSAALVNETAREFVRPSPLARALVPFDPWDSEPVLLLPPAPTLLADGLRRLRLARHGLGWRALHRSLVLAHRWYLGVLRMRLRAARHFQGPSGLYRELVRPALYLAPTRRYDVIDGRWPEDAVPALPASSPPGPR